MKLHLLLILSLSIIGVYSASCPSPLLLEPCTCDETSQSIICVNVNGTDASMRNIFKRSSKSSNTSSPAKFKLFHLKNCHMFKFGSDWFGAKPELHFVFKKIIIENCTQMFEFAHRAITDQNDYIKEIVIKNSPIVNNPRLEQDLEELEDMNIDFGGDPFGYNDIFNGLMTAPSLVNIDISGAQLDKVPNEAFMADHANWGEWMAKSVKFCSGGERCRSIKSVGERPFFYLVHLEMLDLSNHLIDKIARHAFIRKTVRGKPAKKLTIILNDNKLTKDSFDNESLAHLNPFVDVNLSLANNRNLTVLNEKVFKRFLETNDVNKINVTGCPIDWKNNEMKWVDSLENKIKSRIIK